ncbi:hypothetical protein JOL79_10175 [Microbispora sp. RL4-1S]|uniref:Signal transduction histidine kinase subgroup 3 dimerisation and phosphoacceptor domain-containing protein n=1 Tax=Microbispora oryzae TaxID=2806554 RepID=A0A940WHN4_9ACTN|nr:histidine kinase [Microbispora oryzae]MBP2704177.1 hypothetical protein [Microbispora oryzae]
MSDRRDVWLDPLGKDEKGPDARGMYMWAAFTAGGVWDTVHGRSHPVWLAAAALVASAALYCVVVHFAFTDRRRATRTLPFLMVTAFAAAAGFQDNWWFLMPMVAVAAGTALRGRELPVALFAICLAGMVCQLWSGAQDVGGVLTLAWGTLMAGIVPAIIIRLWEAIRELQATRRELAEAAVAQERLRFARDLHDLLGHTLSVMVVKAEAVRRLAPVDAGAAAGQAADIEKIGRQALTEVRAAVTGYRGRGFAAELDSARTALTGAGIAVVVSASSVSLPPETEALLGWAVREGVTNVIRHSDAATCTIDLRRGDGLDGLVLEIRDDGAHGAGHGNGHRDGHGSGHRNGYGNGLTGLRERVGAAGGTMEAGPLAAPPAAPTTAPSTTPPPGAAAGPGFRLRVTVPYEAVPYETVPRAAVPHAEETE